MIRNPSLSFGDTKIFIWVGVILETDTNPETKFEVRVAARDKAEALRQLDRIHMSPVIRSKIHSQDPDIFATPYAELTVAPQGRGQKGFSVCAAQRLGTAGGLNYATIQNKT